MRLIIRKTVALGLNSMTRLLPERNNIKGEIDNETA